MAGPEPSSGLSVISDGDKGHSSSGGETLSLPARNGLCVVDAVGAISGLFPERMGQRISVCTER